MHASRRPSDGEHRAVRADEKGHCSLRRHGRAVHRAARCREGYLNRSELTAEKFVTVHGAPFGSAQGRRVYRSGDQVRWRTDDQGKGQLEFLGRVDRQVKLRGFRIELGDIESRLQQCTSVREAVVQLWGEGDAAQLVAYVVSDAADTVEAKQAALHAQLSLQLPSYMLPAAYVWLDVLPLTVNGKVDLKALPAPDLSTLGTRDTSAAGEIEKLAK